MKKNLRLLLVLALVAGAAAYFYFNRSSKTYQNSFADFSIQDTASVDKIIIADSRGQKIVLTRSGAKWLLNDSLEARPELANLVLRVFKDVIVQSPVGKNAKENTIKRLASVHKMVQIFQDGDSEPTKIWYIGDPTQDHFGTTVLLELPDEGKSPDPYVIEIPWHKGFITPMFMADYKEWMQTPVFVYPDLEFSNVTVSNFIEPSSSFSIEKSGDKLALKDYTNHYLAGFDTIFVKEYLTNYKKVYYEVDDKYLTPFQTDSMLTSKPIYQISIKENGGKLQEVKIFRKKEEVRTIDFEDNPQEFDRDRYYAVINNKRLVLIQRQVFDKLLLTLEDFK